MSLPFPNFLAGSRAKGAEVTANFAYVDEQLATKITKEKLAPSFCMNSGNVDINGNADLLAFSGTNITTKTGGSFGTALGNSITTTPISVTSSLSVNLAGLQDSHYNIFLDNATTLVARPAGFKHRDFLSDFSSNAPVNAYQKDASFITVGSNIAYSSGWLINSNSVPSGKYLRCTSITNFGTKDWTVEGRFIATNLTNAGSIFGTYNSLVPFKLGLTTAGKVAAYLSSTSAATYDIANASLGTTTITAGTEYHFAIVRSKVAGTYKIYINGVLDQTITNSLDMLPLVSGIYFGEITGKVRDIRVNIGTCRYTGAFTPPPAGLIRQKNFFVIGNTFNYNPVAEDIWLDTSVYPHQARRHTGAAWVAYEGIKLGRATLYNGTITRAITNPYNWNGTAFIDEDVYKFGTLSSDFVLFPDKMHTANITGSCALLFPEESTTKERNVLIDFTIAPGASLTLPPNIFWNYEAAPELSTTGVNRFILDTKDSGKTWKGSFFQFAGVLNE